MTQDQDTSDAVHFVKQYRTMEKSSLKSTYQFISIAIADVEDARYLHNSWRNREKNFGSFFLNLTYETMGDIIAGFGIEVDGLGEFKYEKQNKPHESVFLPAPEKIQWLNKLMVFFNNNSVNSSKEIKLDTLPNLDARYGNSINWGKYILSFSKEEQSQVLGQIHTLVTKPENNG